MIIRLADLAHLPLSPHQEYSAAEMEAARAHHVRRGLRYNTRTGVTSDRDGWRARFSNAVDIPSDYDAADVLQWLFRPEISNSASRVRRGFEP